MTHSYPWGDHYAPEDTMSYDGILMDNGMHQSASPSAHYFGNFAYPVQDYLKDSQRTGAIFNAAEYQARPTVGITPVHRPPQARFASPVSSSEPSSASGSAHSPPADTDYPSSPHEEALIVPLMRQDPYNTLWSLPEHSLQFGKMFPDAYVNPVEVNSQQPDFGDNESDTFSFDGHFTRTRSWESYSAPSQCGTEPMSYPRTASITDMPNKRMSSPEDSQPLIKDEIEAANHYPESPLGGDSDDEQAVLPSSPKRKAENDEEWKPSKKVKSGSGRSATRPRSRSAKSAPESSPQHKKRGSKSNPEPSPKTNQPVAARRLPPQFNNAPKNPLFCREQGCSNAKPYADKASLDAHTKKKHTRPYICVFHFAGCESTFASKNEWKRHVNSQHILLNYWLCQEDECSKTCNGPSPVPTNSTASRGSPSSSKSKSPNAPKGVARDNIPNGAIFNRKDLYTQHMRRMHMPDSLKKKISASGNGKKAGTVTNANTTAAQEWEDALRRFQERAIKERCRLPEAMACPAQGCNTEFNGPEAWDQRMEHVARHLDAASQGREPSVVFGGEHDECLTEWAGQEEVAIIMSAGDGWVLAKGNTQTTQGKGKGEKGDVLIVSPKGNNKSKAMPEVVDEIVVGDEDDGDLDAEGEPDI